MAADYGLDAPKEVQTFAIRGAVLIAIAGVMSLTNGAAALPLICIILAIALGFLFSAAVMFWSSRVAKLKMRDRILDGLPWRGDEQVLDVGCGRGLFLIGAAKRLTSGKAVGVDIWRQQDQGRNKAEATLENAKLEGVAAKVKVENADARKLPFPDARFDVVLSSLALHNIDEREDRTKAVEEMVRVLKPGGRMAIFDILRTADYAKDLQRIGMADVELSPMRLLWCLPTRYVTARKP